jgi:hypothetical protein
MLCNIVPGRCRLFPYRHGYHRYDYLLASQWRNCITLGYQKLKLCLSTRAWNELRTIHLGFHVFSLHFTSM